jgi:hypothetical protein
VIAAVKENTEASNNAAEASNAAAEAAKT